MARRLLYLSVQHRSISIDHVATPLPSSRPSGDRVVVVDDLADAANSLAAALELEGFNVRTANDTASALVVVADHDPICVLTDINMPGPSGVELARRLRATYGCSIVLMAVTGSVDDVDPAGAKFADFDYCLRKPVDLARLRRILLPN
ncbi:MAG: response regulator [Chitinophagaceae bacterium]|nr:response regulator [Rubrivivax sp.]